MSFAASSILGILTLLFLVLNVRMLRFVPEARTLLWAILSLLAGLALELGDDPLAASLPEAPVYRPLRLFIVYIDLAFFNGYCFFVALWCRRLVQRYGYAVR